MNEQNAYHEAAHVVIAFLIFKSSRGINDQGIDLNAATSVKGAYGVASVNLFEHDPYTDPEEQKAILISNLVIVCAGPASDAKLLGKSLDDALKKQEGDKRDAQKLLNDSPMIQTVQERQFVPDGALKRVARELEKPFVWDAIRKVAQACLARGGRLAKAQIEEILQDLPTE